MSHLGTLADRRLDTSTQQCLLLAIATMLIGVAALAHIGLTPASVARSSAQHN